MRIQNERPLRYFLVGLIGWGTVIGALALLDIGSDWLKRNPWAFALGLVGAAGAIAVEAATEDQSTIDALVEGLE